MLRRVALGPAREDVFACYSEGIRCFITSSGNRVCGVRACRYLFSTSD